MNRNADDNTQYVTIDAQKIIDGIKFTTDMPFNHMKANLEPTLPKLTSEDCFILPILSRTHIKFFRAFSHY